MVILKDILTEQSFSFIPRSETYDSLFLTDDQTNTEVEITILTVLKGDYYDTISAVFVEGLFSLTENHFYNIEIRLGSKIVLKDRIFCTNQAVATYSINKGEFVSQVSNNEFIIYD